MHIIVILNGSTAIVGMEKAAMEGSWGRKKEGPTMPRAIILLPHHRARKNVANNQKSTTTAIMPKPWHRHPHRPGQTAQVNNMPSIIGILPLRPLLRLLRDSKDSIKAEARRSAGGSIIMERNTRNRLESGKTYHKIVLERPCFESYDSRNHHNPI
mmetsp:Transcript_245/g.494  ORF Transcript_245/g.494 Transcript_245/m.494 type:complete len:156 (-) Transcript_245:22-489(-)